MDLTPIFNQVLAKHNAAPVKPHEFRLQDLDEFLKEAYRIVCGWTRSCQTAGRRTMPANMSKHIANAHCRATQIPKIYTTKLPLNRTSPTPKTSLSNEWLQQSTRKGRRRAIPHRRRAHRNRRQCQTTPPRTQSSCQKPLRRRTTATRSGKNNSVQEASETRFRHRRTMGSRRSPDGEECGRDGGRGES